MLSTIPILVTVLYNTIHVGALSTTDYATHATESWSIKNLKSVVTFGDSYTDESRISFFVNHSGAAPPTGWIGPLVSLCTIRFYIISPQSQRPEQR
jgi:hypothetical protein